MWLVFFPSRRAAKASYTWGRLKCLTSRPRRTSKPGHEVLRHSYDQEWARRLSGNKVVYQNYNIVKISLTKHNYLLASLWENIKLQAPMTAKGSSMPSTSVPGITPSLKMPCCLGLDRKCVSRMRPSFKVDGWRWGWRNSRNQSLPKESQAAICWLVKELKQWFSYSILNQCTCNADKYFACMFKLKVDCAHSLIGRLSELRTSQSTRSILLRIQMRLAGPELWAIAQRAEVLLSEL